MTEDDARVTAKESKDSGRVAVAPCCFAVDGERSTEDLDCAPIPASAFGPAVNAHGYYVGRVVGNLYWVTDGTYQSAFLTTREGVVLFDAPPTIGHNIQRAVDEIAAANGVSNRVTHLVYSHHHADHGGASCLFRNITRIGHENTRRLLLRDDDPARPAPEETFRDRRTVEIGGERIDLAWHGPNHSPDNIFIHLPDHDALMLVDVAAAPVIEKYTGVLAAADTFTASATFHVTQSIRLDLGYASQIHP
jgi:glyoxylase-like metal-dependent hydrolase (beta-lactamase superfamily II)